MRAHDNCISNYWGGLGWTPWIELNAPLAKFRNGVPKAPGFYRIRKTDANDLIYVGQTGRSLRERTRALANNTYRSDDMPPWNDPHTAAPLLWAYRIKNGLSYQVSVAAAKLDFPTRQCTEDALLFLHRKEHGHSTQCNHGRLHPMWTRPTNRGKNEPATRRKFPVPYTSLPPVSGHGTPCSPEWLGLAWTDFVSSSKLVPSTAGIYRIRIDNDLIYLGESKNLKTRIYAHLKTPRLSGCMVSYAIMDGADAHHLKERETDLIGAYFLSQAKPPAFQYQPSINP